MSWRVGMLPSETACVSATVASDDAPTGRGRVTAETGCVTPEPSTGRRPETGVYCARFTAPIVFAPVLRTPSSLAARSLTSTVKVPDPAFAVTVHAPLWAADTT